MGSVFSQPSVFTSLVKYSSSHLEKTVSFPGRNLIMILIKSCQLSTVTTQLCWTRSSGHCTAKLLCSQQLAWCWRIPDHQNFAMGSSHSAVFFLQRRGREASMMIATVVLVILVNEVFGACGPGAFSTVIQEFVCL